MAVIVAVIVAVVVAGVRPTTIQTTRQARKGASHLITRGRLECSAARRQDAAPIQIRGELCQPVDYYIRRAFAAVVIAVVIVKLCSQTRQITEFGLFQCLKRLI